MGRQRTQAGFTLIELLVVITLSVMLTIAGVGLFMSTIVGSAKKDSLTQVKNEGDYALGQMEFMLRNASALVVNPNSPTSPICTGGMSSISFKNPDNGITTLYTYTDATSWQHIASLSSFMSSNPYYFTSKSVVLSQPLTFDCQQSSTNYGTYVHISFGLQDPNYGYNQPVPITTLFDTSVSMRND